MSPMGWDSDVVTRFKADRFVNVFKLQESLAKKQNYPLVVGLVVPKTIGTGVSHRKDALDAHIRPLSEDGSHLVG